MRKQYAASMYSEKSTTSAKSGRSFLSMTVKQPTKVGFWKSLKSWRSSSTSSTKNNNRKDKDNDDDDMSAVLCSSASSSASSLVSYTKFKRLLLPSFSSSNTTTTTPSSSSKDNNNNNNGSSSSNNSSKEDVNEAVATEEQYKESSEKVVITASAAVAPSSRRARNDKGILLRDAQAVAERRRQRRQRQPSERVTFIEPSPVPRFRNAPPLPPASPPYLDIIMQQDGGSSRSSIIQHEEEAGEPTVFTTPFDHNNNNNNTMNDNNNDDDEDEKKKKLKKKHHHHHKKRSHLCFRSPLQRGQTLTFSLQNVTPDDHIIVFKFLTSNARLQRSRTNHSRRHSSASSLQIPTTNKWPAITASDSHLSLMERYFVRPSAGRMIETDQMDIMLFLNQVPEDLAPNEILKDKILVRWAVVQRNTQVDAWVQAQPDSTRRKWLEMLVEQWPDQVIVRETRLKIRFM